MYNMRKMNNYNQSVYLFKIFKIQNFHRYIFLLIWIVELDGIHVYLVTYQFHWKKWIYINIFALNEGSIFHF